MFRAAARRGQGLRVAAAGLLAVGLAAACGTTPGPVSPGPGTANPTAAAPFVTATPPASRAPGAPATPRSSVAPPTPKAFWAAAGRAVERAGQVQVTLAGPNPGVLRFEPAASATVVGGKVVFVCIGGAAYDGQSGFAPVPGSWQCGAAALVSGFRRIGQPADSWSASSPSDASITEAVTQGSDGTWTWKYAGISPFLGRVTARVTLDPASGRILTARRTDATGTTTYTFDYATKFPALAVPKR